MAPPYGEPDWATPGDTSTATQNAGTGGGVNVPITSNSNRGEGRSTTKCVISLLSFVNMGLAAMMGALGILALIGFTPESAGSNLTAAFLSVYMVVFAILLFLYELIWWQPFPNINKMFRKNFGFMYGLKGKGFYLIFIAFLCLGLKDQNIGGVAGAKGLDWATGLGWLAGGIFHLFISYTWPEANDCYRPPSAGFTETAPDPNVV